MQYHYNFTYNIRYVTVLITVLHLTGLVSAQDQGWPLHPDSANIAILKFDYQTYAFEGATYSNYAPCTNCDPDSLPWDIIYHEPGDFGDITFQYLPTMDSLFFATIIWMGEGEIFIPDSFRSPGSFYYWDSVNFTPDTIYHFLEDTWGGSWWEEEADSLWSSIQLLGLANLQQFTQNKTQVGLYLYPPSVGTFDPSVAKWIVFFYQDLTREPDYDTTYALSFFPLATGNKWQYYGISAPMGEPSSFTGYETITVANDTLLGNGKRYFEVVNLNWEESVSFLRADTASLAIMKYNTSPGSWCPDTEFVFFDLTQVLDTSVYYFCNGFEVHTQSGVENYTIIPGDQPTMFYSWFLGVEEFYTLAKGIGIIEYGYEELGGWQGYLTACTINGVQYGEYYIGPTSYFPIQTGHFWDYSDQTDTFSVQIEDSLLINNNTYYTYNNYRPQDFGEFNFRVEGNQVFSLNNDTAFVMYDFDADSGESWDLIAAGMPSTMFLVDINGSVSTPVGDFENCFVFNHIFGMDYEYLEWFAPEVGLVQRDDITIAGPHRWQLTDFGQMALTEDSYFPEKFLLYQNYPNPFNPVTTLRYELPKQAHVKLSIFDLLGREVAVLVNSFQVPGVREIQFDASDLTSGMYLYRLTYNNSSITKKMVVLK
ncbi:MAG: T9SS type A sorting domain-containing protein [Candidatus Marinimicrobia bacterium]|nr:T9SS type A sorting domain-containing protein [Candidatus Neomarinimicrobiota bacterium]